MPAPPLRQEQGRHHGLLLSVMQGQVVAGLELSQVFLKNKLHAPAQSEYYKALTNLQSFLV